MARPIKDTPILYGKESDKFLKQVKDNESKKTSDEEYMETKTLFNRIMANAKI
jgi:hypothetical protein